MVHVDKIKSMRVGWYMYITNEKPNTVISQINFEIAYGSFIW